MSAINLFEILVFIIMRVIYTFLVYFLSKILPLIALFNNKIKLFVDGRKRTIPILEEKIEKEDKIIWIHTASLGEYEQGLPIIKSLKAHYPKNKVVVSFFSPSGYEVKKNTTDADVIVYLPLDIPSKVTDFLDAIHPEVAIFIKYEFWLNYLFELKKRNIPTFLVSGIFRERQIFFRWYGVLMRKALRTFSYFFVQNETSKNLLESIGFNNIMVSGDTRFDRVLEILDRDNRLEFIEKFVGGSLCLVVGSSWQEDESLYLNFVNYCPENIKIIIAPHNINEEKLTSLRRKVSKKTIFFSEKEGKDLSNYQVFIIDTIGLLTKIYSYADFAYVGGGMKTGLHNVLEPAVFGIPIIIGTQYNKFAEAKALVALGGILSVGNEKDFNKVLYAFVVDKNLREKAGAINKKYIEANKGATDRFIQFIDFK